MLWETQRQNWPDSTAALRRAGTLWTNRLPKSAEAVARGLLDVRAAAEERSLDLHELLDASSISPPSTPAAVFHARAVISVDPHETPGDADVTFESGSSTIRGRLITSVDRRRSPLDPTLMENEYVLLRLTLPSTTPSSELADASQMLVRGMHHLAAHEVLARSAQALNDALAIRVRQLMDENTEVHQIDNIKREIAQLQQEFTEEVEAGWSFGGRYCDLPLGLVDALDDTTDLRGRWESQCRRFERLASIADFAPSVGPPIAGPRDLLDIKRVGAAEGKQIRDERRLLHQLLRAYSRWWSSRILYEQGRRANDDAARLVELGRTGRLAYNLGAGLDHRITEYRSRQALDGQRDDSERAAKQPPPRRGLLSLLGSRRSSEPPHPRVVELHPFRNRQALFEELNGAMQRTTFFAASTLVFLGAVLQGPGEIAASDVDILLLLLAVFGFLFATLMFGRLTTRLARRTTIGFDGRFRTADRVADYLGVFPLLLALPLVVSRFVDTDAIRIGAAALAITVTTLHLRFSSRLQVDIADNALSTTTFRRMLAVAILGIMGITLAASLTGAPRSVVTMWAIGYMSLLALVTLLAAVVPPWSDDSDYGNVPSMRDGEYAVHPWDALSDESPDYHRRSFGTDYQGERLHAALEPDGDGP